MDVPNHSLLSLPIERYCRFANLVFLAKLDSTDLSNVLELPVIHPGLSSKNLYVTQGCDLQQIRSPEALDMPNLLGVIFKRRGLECKIGETKSRKAPLTAFRRKDSLFGRTRERLLQEE